MRNRPAEPVQSDTPDIFSYTLEELTSATGLTVRTVRYYISEGLLPPPHGAGPGTRYTREHLDRLILIGALKDAYLPLKEIRRRIAAMTSDEVHDAVATLHTQAPTSATGHDDDAISATGLTASPPAGVAAGAAAGAAAYIESVLRDESTSRSGRRGGTDRAARTPPRAMRFPGANEPDPQPDAEPAPATWRRLAISPEAELLIEESTYQRRRDQIDALVAWAQRILTT